MTQAFGSECAPILLESQQKHGSDWTTENFKRGLKEKKQLKDLVWIHWHSNTNKHKDMLTRLNFKMQNIYTFVDNKKGLLLLSEAKSY